jgi:two-component system LytT family sensor kinase
MKRIAIFGVHLSYWTIYFLFTATFLAILANTGTPETQKEYGRLFQFYWIVNVIPSLLGFYTYHYFLFSKIKKITQWYKIILIGISLSLVIGIVATIIFKLSYVFEFNKHTFDLEAAVLLIILTGIVSLIHGILGLFMRAFFDWFNLRKEKDALKEQNYQIEMELVKAQLNPHFLFNSLNNIDILIHKDQEMASSYLNKLSDILRYMLFDTKAEMMTLETEFQFIEKYMSLHQLRASNPDYVTLQNNVNEQQGKVASLVFIPYIENAFKYSSSYKEGNAIQIALNKEGSQLHFSCKNRINVKQTDLTNTNGLGNELLKKRLDLIYKDQYNLNIHQENGYFCVDLTIPYEAN